MGKVVLDFGTEVDMLNKGELSDALAENEEARLRALLIGVKSGDLWLNSGTPGMGANSYTATGAVPQCPAAGFVWAVMNIGIEVSAASNFRVWKSNPSPAPPTGGGRAVAVSSGSQTINSVSFSKGQFTLRAGDIWSIQAVTGAVNILSIFMTYIEIPAERIGELLL